MGWAGVLLLVQGGVQRVLGQLAKLVQYLAKSLLASVLRFVY